MIDLGNQRPRNAAHVSRLLAFCEQILAVCRDLDIEPVLSGSLAVFGYTQNQTMCVHDVDLACSEREFPRLSHSLDEQGIAHQVTAWHVLQARKDDLKVEFDALEVWMADLPDDYDTLVIDGCAFNVVSLSSLKKLYRRGLEATRSGSDEAERAKHAAIAEKIEMLCSV